MTTVRRRRIGLYLGGTGSDGGTYQYALSLLHAFARLPVDQYEVFAFCKLPEWERRSREVGVTPLPVPAYPLLARAVSKLLRMLPLTPLSRAINSAVVPFGRVLKREGFDLCIYPNFEQFAYELSTPSIGAIHDLMHRHEPSFPEVSTGAIPRRRDHLFSSIYRGATVTLVDSEIGKQHVVDAYGGTGESIVVLPYPVPGYIVADSGGRADASPADVADLPGKYFFYPAQFWPHKNHLRLLEALAHVKRSEPDVHLALAGSEKVGYQAVLDAIAERDLPGNVTLLGYVPDEAMPGLYRRARALIFPTMFGPTGIPPIEAQAVGCPVAASGTYGYPEQLGEGALYFDPWSADEIASCMLRLWTDDALCESLAAQGSENVQRFLPDRFAERLTVVIETACEWGER